MADRTFIYDEFEKLGEDTVREYIRIKRWNEGRHALAKEWIARKGRERSSQSDDERRLERAEDRRIARSAKNAAWIAAIAAIIAAISAIIVMVHPASPTDSKPVAAKTESPR